MVPFERAAINAALLSSQERQWLNQYHAAVYAALAPLLDEADRSTLADATAEI